MLLTTYHVSVGCQVVNLVRQTGQLLPTCVLCIGDLYRAAPSWFNTICALSDAAHCVSATDKLSRCHKMLTQSFEAKFNLLLLLQVQVVRASSAEAQVEESAQGELLLVCVANISVSCCWPHTCFTCLDVHCKCRPVCNQPHICMHSSNAKCVLTPRQPDA